MAHLLSSAHRKRNELFDEQLSTTIDTLNMSEVQKSLGYGADELSRAVQNAFLPNIRYGVARLPQEQTGTSNVAFLPFLKSDGNPRDMRISRALAAPSAAMFAVASVETSTKVADQYLKEFNAKTYKLGSNVKNGMTSVCRMVVDGTGAGRVAMGRSVITMAHVQRSQANIAETVAHEFRHATDNYRFDFDPRVVEDIYESKRLHASHEYRAYRISHLLLNALNLYDDTSLAMMNAWNEFDLGSSMGRQIPDAAVMRAEALGVL